MQKARHDADYDPTHHLTPADAEGHIARAEEAIGGLNAAGERERRAFAVHLLFRRRT